MIVWRYEIVRESRAEFEKEYGPAGAWAELFGRGEGYVRTDLFRDCGDEAVYLTIDCWDSEQAFDAFRLDYADQYRALDRRFEKLTVTERRLGTFSD